MNPQRGIFKPRQLPYLLSIKTVFPRPGRRIWYEDQMHVHAQVFNSEETVDYAFMGKNPNAADNRWLREAHDHQIPIIYFLGIAPGRYQPIFPVFITGWDANRLTASVAFAPPEQTSPSPPQTAVERRYALTVLKRRLHQAAFREAVITAYGNRCALSGLPEPVLLDAAHIIVDRDEQLGQPVVQNGIPLSKTHHAAFDAHLIGIDPDYRVHVSERLMSLHDGPMLKSLQQLRGITINLPNREKDFPDRDRLAIRFEQFASLS